MQVVINQLKNSQIKWALLFLLIISFFCIFKTYARSAYIGLIIFWAISLWGYNKKYFSIVLILSLIIGLLYLTNLEQIFFKTPEFDVNVATSGRIFIWEHNINFFLESSFDRKLMGHGLGVVASSVIGERHEIWSSHNDYLHVLMALGSIGLVLYFIINLALLKDIYLSSIDKPTKFFYYGIILSMIAMNFASGVNLYQFGISQQFWMVMGFFYVFRDLNAGPSNSN
jgi:O-antigen ligase